MDYFGYSHGYNMAIFSNDVKMNSYKITDTASQINTGVLYDKDYVGMSNDSAISYDLGTLKPGEIKEFSICIFVCENSEKNRLDEIEAQIDKARKIDVEKELQNTKRYWRKYVKAHTEIELEGSIYKEKLRSIYTRTILLFPLLMNSRNWWNVSCYGNR